MALPYDFWTAVEKKLEYVLYGDTDSIYIKLPVDSEDVQHSMDISQAIAEDINSIIRNYLNQFILNKMNIEPQYNFTFFKTELTAHSIIFLETKKNYAFNASSLKNKILPKPKVEYVGIPIVKVNTPKFSSYFIKVLTEDIALADIDKSSIREKLDSLGKNMDKLLEDCIAECNIEYIGTPGKWNETKKKANSHVTGMRLYNSLTNTESFKPLTAGYSIGVKLSATAAKLIEDQVATVKNNSTLYFIGAVNTVNFISIPYGYNPEEVKALFIKFGIFIDKKDTFSSLYNTVAMRIVNTIKTYAGIPR